MSLVAIYQREEINAVYLQEMTLSDRNAMTPHLSCKCGIPVTFRSASKKRSSHFAARAGNKHDSSCSSYFQTIELAQALDESLASNITKLDLPGLLKPPQKKPNKDRTKNHTNGMAKVRRPRAIEILFHLVHGTRGKLHRNHHILINGMKFAAANFFVATANDLTVHYYKSKQGALFCFYGELTKGSSDFGFINAKDGFTINVPSTYVKKDFRKRFKVERPEDLTGVKFVVIGTLTAELANNAYKIQLDSLRHLHIER
jgi:hypothetical protein